MNPSNRANIDAGNPIDWGKTSKDYSAWRPNYPDRFFDALAVFGVGLRGQRILDLGTGVGFLALRFAQQGCDVAGVDIAEGQILEARNRARSLGLPADFRVAPAEDTGLDATSFDAITASQSWLYFDKKRAINEVKRLLKPDGILCITHFSWLPRENAIVRETEQLVLKYNQKWTGADWAGEIPFVPKWAADQFRMRAMFVFDAAIPFTRESWRGRVRACRGVGATLATEQIEAFDREHEQMLTRIAPESFTISHRIDAQLFQAIH
jgi:SAM-dependent methyltransferase